jgi:hypothetical protein
LPSNLVEYSHGVPQHFIIPKAHHCVPVLGDDARARFVVSRVFGVLSTVDLHDELVAATAEVGDEAADRHLAPEL